jgi:hypothetical protein
MTTLSFRRSMPLLWAFGVSAAVVCAAGAQTLPTMALQSATENAAPPAVTAAAQTKPALEPKAVDILKAACARLAAAHSMSFTAIVTYENPSRLGFPLAYGTKSDVLLERPNKLRVITLFDGPASEFYYDGKTMMALSPAENLVAVAAAPPTSVYPRLSGARRQISWLMTVEGYLSKRGLAPKINCRDCSAQFTTMIRCICATCLCSATGSLT